MSRATKFIGGASEIAHYYGFKPLPEIAPEIGMKHKPLAPADAATACASKITATSDPVLAFYAAAGTGGRESAVAQRDAGVFSLQIVGCPSSIGEVHILKTLEAIIAEHGSRVACARINSLGDRDSRARFARELSSFLRRHSDSYEAALAPQEKAMLVENPLHAYTSKNTTLLELLREAPRPVHYLSEKSRTHFRQVLEHLERVDFPYVIDDMLIGDERLPMSEIGDPRITFELDLEEAAPARSSRMPAGPVRETSMLSATVGGRYDELISRPGGRGIPMVHACIEFRTKTPLSSLPAKTPQVRPKVYFIQFGDSAKLTGFSVLDTLRRARVPVSQQFDARHLAPQLMAAQGLGVPYVLIMGAREALDQTVIIRTLATSAQTTVSIAELPKHLRALKLV